MSFTALGLSPSLLKALAEQGYSEPTPIQAKAIPPVFAGRDLLGAAQTSTGKTAAFTLPLLQRLSATPASGNRPVRALIVTPTRELAAQIGESIANYGRYLPLRACVIFGGVSINNQIRALRQGMDIVVATPGRLLDLHGQRAIDLSKVEVLGLDEADRMLDMGFIPDVRRILNLLPKQRQSLLFSATFAPPIRELATTMLNNPLSVEVAPRNTTAEGIKQRVIFVDKGRKRALLSHIIRKGDWQQVLVFAKTKHGANRLAEQLNNDGIPAMAIHGNKSQPARIKALSQFKSGEICALVATDIAARGIDIAQLPHVVNYELPQVAEDYVHRIGRTGRAGAEGEAVSLVCGEERSMLRSIERVSNQRIPSGVEPGFEPTPGGERNPPPDDDRPPRGPRPQRGPRPASSGDRQGNRGDRQGNRDGASRDNRGNSNGNSGARPAGNPRPGHGPRTNQPVGHGQGNRRGGGGGNSGGGNRGGNGGGQSSGNR